MTLFTKPWRWNTLCRWKHLCIVFQETHNTTTALQALCCFLHNSTIFSYNQNKQCQQEYSSSSISKPQASANTGMSDVHPPTQLIWTKACTHLSRGDNVAPDNQTLTFSVLQAFNIFFMPKPAPWLFTKAARLQLEEGRLRAFITLCKLRSSTSTGDKHLTHPKTYWTSEAVWDPPETSTAPSTRQTQWHRIVALLWFCCFNDKVCLSISISFLSYAEF